jgi:F420-non-reducing hydrogenase large subunit
VVGVVRKVGLEVGKKVIGMRRRLRELIAYFGGKVIHPVLGVPGGVSKGLAAGDLPRFKQLAMEALEFALFTNQVFHEVVLKNPGYVELITSAAYTHRTYYLGLVDEQNRVNFYDGQVRVVDATGGEYAKFGVRQYREYVAEHVEPWSYMKFCYLKPLGWQGLVEGPGSSVYGVAPLARLNAAEGMATALAQKAYEEYLGVLGGRPVHHTLANHWARVVEMIYAAERMVELIHEPDITSPEVRVLPRGVPREGMGVVEAPRGTLFHHYETDERGLIRKANLIVATQNNAARIALSVDRAAKALIHQGVVSEGLLNRVEMAFRAYDPCFGCATHSLPGHVPLVVNLYDAQRQLVRQLIQS